MKKYLTIDFDSKVPFLCSKKKNKLEVREVRKKLVKCGGMMEISEKKEGSRLCIPIQNFNWFLLIIYQVLMSHIPATKKKQNIFSLCRLKKECKYPPVSVDFHPIKRSSQTYHHVMPFFNNDGKYYTPAFINPYEQSLFKWSQMECLQNDKLKFIKKVQANQSKPEQSNPFFNPKDDLYCSICRVSFTDYWKHIGSSTHHRKLVASTGDRFIREMCEPFSDIKYSEIDGKNKKRADPPGKTKKIKKKGKSQKPPTKLTISKSMNLMVKLPLELFSREERAMQSTNVFTSQNQKP